jgi:hypothetical protein
LVAPGVNILPFYISKKVEYSAYAFAVLFGVLSKLCVAKPEMLPKLEIEGKIYRVKDDGHEQTSSEA